MAIPEGFDINNRPAIDRVRYMIYDFINKHQSNVKIWTDGNMMIIQLSNVGVRDKNFSYIAHLVKYTKIEEDIRLFDLPCRCVYASNTVIRFCGSKNIIVNYLINEFRNNELVFPPDEFPIIPIPETIKEDALVADEDNYDVMIRELTSSSKDRVLYSFFVNKSFKKEINILKEEWKKDQYQPH